MNTITIAGSTLTAIERNFVDSLMVFRLDFRAHRLLILFGITAAALKSQPLIASPGVTAFYISFPNNAYGQVFDR